MTTESLQKTSTKTPHAGAPESIVLSWVKEIPQCPQGHPDSILINDHHCVMCGYHYWTDEDRAALAAALDAQPHEVKQGSEVQFTYRRKTRIGLVLGIDQSKKDPGITLIYDDKGEPKTTTQKASEVWI